MLAKNIGVNDRLAIRFSCQNKYMTDGDEIMDYWLQ